MELDEAFWLLSLQLIVIFSHFKFYWLILSQALHPKLISHFKKSILWILWHEACSVLPRYVFHDGRSCTFFFFSVLPPWKWTKKISVPYKNTKLGKLSALDSLLCIICADACFALEFFFSQNTSAGEQQLWMCIEVHLTSGIFSFCLFSFSPFCLSGAGGKLCFSILYGEWKHRFSMGKGSALCHWYHSWGGGRCARVALHQ